MSNNRYTADLIDSALFNANEATDGSSDYEAKALEYLNRAYQSVIMGGAEFTGKEPEPWWWLRKTGIFTLQPAETGTVTVTQDSTTVTFSAAPAVTRVGWYLKTTDADVYQIATHTGGVATATLDSPYTGETGDKTYTLMRLDYDLETDLIELLDPMKGYRQNVTGEYRITGADQDALESEWPLAQVDEGYPTRYTLVTDKKVHFNRYPPERIRLDYVYLYQPADLTNSVSEEPAIPYAHRKVLADICATYILNDKDDAKANNMGLIAKTGLEAMIKQNRAKWARTGKVGYIYARQGKRARGALRTATGTIFP